MHRRYGSHTVAAKIQDILICTEMFGFAVWHRKCFTYAGVQCNKMRPKTC